MSKEAMPKQGTAALVRAISDANEMIFKHGDKERRQAAKKDAKKKPKK